jgi:protein O-mannosyl-transferase
MKTGSKNSGSPSPDLFSNKTGKLFSHPAVLPGLLVLIILAVYLPAVFHGFLHWDDMIYVVSNPLVQVSSMANLREIFTTSFDGHYHPLVLLSFSVDRIIAGQEAWFYHAVNLIFHVLNCLLVFQISKMFLRNQMAAFLAAMLFGLHPLQVESVAWITARKDVLYAFFYLMSLRYYLLYIASLKKYVYALASIFFVLAILTKEQAVTLAPTLVLMDFYYKRKLADVKVILEKLPFFIIAIIMGFVVMWAQADTGYMKPLSGEAVSFFNRLVLGSFGLLMYLFKFVLPVNLSAYYPYPFDSVQTAPPAFWWSLLMIPAYIAGLYFSYKKNRLIFTGLIFFLVHIVLMLRFLHANPGDYIIADRYMYVASIGLFWMVADGMRRLLAAQNPVMKKVMAVIPIIVVAALMAATSLRIPVWKDSLTLLNDILRKHPAAYTALNCRGLVHVEMQNYSLALSDFNQAITVNSLNDRAFANRGRVLMLTGDFRRSLDDMNMAVKLDAGNAGNLVNRGLLQLQLGNMELAQRDFDRALEMHPGYAPAHLGKGTAHLYSQNYHLAVTDFTLALQHDPELADAYLGRARAYRECGDVTQAMADYNTVIDGGPDDAVGYYERGLVFYGMHDFFSAIEDFSAAISKDPSHAMAIAYRGFAWYNLNAFDKAVADLSKTLTIQPDYDLAYAMRGMAFLHIGLTGDACADFRTAANLGNAAAADALQTYCADGNTARNENE